MKTTQISARIDSGMKAELEAFLKARGLKQNRFIEDAVRHYLRVLRSLPDDGRVPTSLVFTNQSFDEILRSLRHPGKPTADLVKLMNGDLDAAHGLY